MGQRSVQGTMARKVSAASLGAQEAQSATVQAGSGGAAGLTTERREGCLGRWRHMRPCQALHEAGSRTSG